MLDLAEDLHRRLLDRAVRHVDQAPTVLAAQARGEVELGHHHAPSGVGGVGGSPQGGHAGAADAEQDVGVQDQPEHPLGIDLEQARGGREPVDERLVGHLQSAVGEVGGEGGLARSGGADQDHVRVQQPFGVPPVIGVHGELDGLDALEVAIVGAVEEFGHPRGDPVQESAEAGDHRPEDLDVIDLVTLGELTGQRPHVLSGEGGDDQRLLLARVDEGPDESGLGAHVGLDLDRPLDGPELLHGGAQELASGVSGAVGDHENGACGGLAVRHGIPAAQRYYRAGVSPAVGEWMGCLDDVRVLDLSRLLPGPACTAWLAGQGARVDRVETPGRGDFARHIPPFVGGVGAYFAATAPGKRHLAVNLRRPEGVQLIREILPSYDVLVEGFKPRVIEAMGLAPDDLLRLKPSLVIARLSGFGQSGPYADRPGHDLNYLGLTGMVDGMARMPDGRVAPPPFQLADMAGALVAAAGIASALVRAARTGEGGVVDVSLTEAALWCAGPPLLAATAEGIDPEPHALPLDGGLPVYGTYRCADGKWLTVGALEPRFQQALAEGLGDEASTPWEDLFASQPRDEWVDRLASACVGPALRPSEVASDPHLHARDAVRRMGPATFVRPAAGDWPSMGGAPPKVGAHTDEVLQGAGVPRARVEALREQGVVE